MEKRKTIKEETKSAQQPEKIDVEQLGLQSLGIGTNLVMAARRFKSVRRAIKRNHVTHFGVQVARRPFNNRANTSKRKGVHSRVENLIKQRDYEGAKRNAN